MLVIFTERLALATRPRLAILLRPCLHAVETCGRSTREATPRSSFTHNAAEELP